MNKAVVMFMRSHISHKEERESAGHLPTCEDTVRALQWISNVQVYLTCSHQQRAAEDRRHSGC